MILSIIHPHQLGSEIVGVLGFIPYKNICSGEVKIIKIMQSYYETVMRRSLVGAGVSLPRYILHPAGHRLSLGKFSL